MKQILLIMCAIALSFSVKAQLLYKISGNNLKSPSYIIGTCHAVKASFIDSIPGTKWVLSQVQQVCGEVNINYLNNRDTILAFLNIFMLPSDSLARDIMTQSQYDTLCQVVKNNYNIDLQAPEYEHLLKMRPVVLQQLIPELAKRMNPFYSANLQPNMDEYFQKDAEMTGKNVLGLETISFQLQMLTDFGIPLQKQYDIIIEDFAKKDSDTEELVSIYKTMNIKKLDNYFREQLTSYDEFTKIMVDKRNENWIQKMPSIMTGKSTLFAVGAGHLTGEKGVLNLLKEKGYKITPVKK